MIRFYNGKTLLFENNDIVISDDEVHVSGDRIEYVGPARAGVRYEREIDLNGDLLIPGFKNAHTHSPMTMLRSYADDLPLDEWLHNKIFPMEKQWNDE